MYIVQWFAFFDAFLNFKFKIRKPPHPVSPLNTGKKLHKCICMNCMFAVSELFYKNLSHRWRSEFVYEIEEGCLG